ncbi:MAG: disulfide oxidoreductase [Patescibacteria group bacterium]|nr:disulfide oxidoreductase [Patescibacteria group bacterium]
MITEETPLLEVFQQKDKLAFELLLPILGGGCATCPMAAQENLGEALQSHGLNKKEIKKVIEELNK